MRQLTPVGILYYRKAIGVVAVMEEGYVDFVGCLSFFQNQPMRKTATQQGNDHDCNTVKRVDQSIYEVI